MKTKTIKTIIIIFILTLGINMSVFAADATTTSPTDTTHFVLQLLTNFLSRGWVVFASMAGKLMSNDRVYGSIFNMDVILWKVWNISKNLANYTIGFMFLFYVIKHLFSSSSTETTGQFIKTKIVGFLIAGILIQSSWFLVGAVIDLSTVATAAIGSFPASFIETNSSYNETIKNSLADLLKLKKQDGTVKSKLSEEDINKETINRFIDRILPTSTDVSGPLIFMGTSIFQFFNYTSAIDPENQGKSVGVVEEFASMTINFLVIAIYSFTMLMLVVINLIRIGVIRIFVSFSPFIFLFTVLSKMDIAKIGEDGGVPEWLQFGSILGLIFQPVVFVAYLSLMLLLTLGIYGVIHNNNTTFIIHEISGTTSISGGSFNVIINSLKTTTVDLLLYALIIFLLWKLIGIASKSSSITESVTKTIMDTGGGLLKSMPIAKIKGDDGKSHGISWNEAMSAKNRLSSNISNKMHIDLKSGNFDVGGANRVNKLLNQKILGKLPPWDETYDELLKRENSYTQIINKNNFNAGYITQVFQDIENINKKARYLTVRGSQALTDLWYNLITTSKGITALQNYVNENTNLNISSIQAVDGNKDDKLGTIKKWLNNNNNKKLFHKAMGEGRTENITTLDLLNYKYKAKKSK